MKIKKFTCNGCGAPKMNSYTSPYIVCDFCGSFTDIDYTMGLQSWNKDPKRTEKYQKADRSIQSKLAKFVLDKNKKEYYDLQIKYWDLYYKIYPEYLPPTISFDTENYKLYLDICADSSTDAAFDDSQQKLAEQQSKIQQAIKYEVINGVTRVETNSFFRMIHAYTEYLKESFRVFYETPEYALMHKLLPHDTHLKMKVSTLVQVWLPYLKETDAKRFLEETKFTHDYVEIQKVNGADQKCEFCEKMIYVPEGAVKVHCEACHRTNSVKRNFNCISCGVENSIPDHPVHTIDCVSCNTENRLITRLF